MYREKKIPDRFVFCWGTIFFVADAAPTFARVHALARCAAMPAFVVIAQTHAAQINSTQVLTVEKTVIRFRSNRCRRRRE